MRMNYRQKNQVSVLKMIAWIVTILSVTYLSYSIYEKYNLLKSGFGSSEDFVIFFLSYFIGGLLGASVLPIIFWVFYILTKKIIKNKIIRDLNREIKLFENNNLTSAIFVKKSQSLFDLKKKKIITLDEFEIKYVKLFEECRAILKIENYNKKNQEIIQSLDDAFANGIISKKEYLSKKMERTNNTESIPKFIIDRSNCPVCKTYLSETDKECPSCGIIIIEN